MGWRNKIVQQKKYSNQEASSNKIIDNDMEYKHRRAIAKTEIRKRHYKSSEEFVSHLESAIYTYKKKTNTFKLLKHMSIDAE